MLVSPLPLDECLARLAAATDRPWSLTGRTAVIGRVSGTTFTGRRRISYRNSFQARVVARLEAQGGNTLVRCRFGMHPAVVVFMVFWLGTVSMIGLGTLAELARAWWQRQPLGPDWAINLVPIGMALFGVALLLGGRLLGRGDRAVLLGFLRETLDARDAPPALAPA